MQETLETVITSLDRRKRHTQLSLVFVVLFILFLIFQINSVTRQFESMVSEIGLIENEFEARNRELRIQVDIARSESLQIQELYKTLAIRVEANSELQRQIALTDQVLGAGSNSAIAQFTLNLPLEVIEEQAVQEPGLQQSLVVRSRNLLVEATRELDAQPEIARDNFRLLIDVYNDATEIDSEALSTAYWGAARASINLQESEQQQALTDINLALENTNSSTKKSQLYSDRGRIYLRLGQISNALEDQNLSIELNSNYTSAYLRRGLINMMNNEHELAREDFQVATKGAIGKANLASARENIGLLELYLENPAAALEQADDVNLIDDKSIWNWAIRLLAAQQLNLTDVGEESLTQLMELQATAHDNSIWLYLNEELTEQLIAATGQNQF